jgi:hypothetical protein
MPLLSNFTDCSASACAKTVLPAKTASACDCKLWSGRINDIYFVDCGEEVSPTNIVDTGWWEDLVANGKIFNFGAGIGGFKVKDKVVFDAGGCGTATIQNMTWQITYKVFCVDKSTAFYTHNFANTLLAGALKNYNVILRLCDGENTLVPIGSVQLGDFDNELPDDNNAFFSFMYEFNWKSMEAPLPIEVAGLSSVISKSVR